MRLLRELILRVVHRWWLLVGTLIFGVGAFIAWLVGFAHSLPVPASWFLIGFVLTVIAALTTLLFEVAAERDKLRLEPDTQIRERHNEIADLMTKGQEALNKAYSSASDEEMPWEETAIGLMLDLRGWEADVTAWLEKESKPVAVRFTYAVGSHHLPDEDGVWIQGGGKALTAATKRMRAGLDLLNDLLSDRTFGQ